MYSSDIYSIFLNIISLAIILIIIWVFIWLISIIFRFIFTNWEESKINLVYNHIKQLIIWTVFIVLFFVAFFSLYETYKPIWYKLYTSENIYNNTIRIITILSDKNNYLNKTYSQNNFYNSNSGNFSL